MKRNFLKEMIPTDRKRVGSNTKNNQCAGGVRCLPLVWENVKSIGGDFIEGLQFFLTALGWTCNANE
jgi:hypothetical protein